MKVTEQDIISTVRHLRDEDNERLHVSPWSHRPKRSTFHVPSWLVAVPAAAILGFVFGFWTKSNSQIDASLTALVDTVYIKVHDPQPPRDTIAQLIPKPQRPTPQTTKRPTPQTTKRPTPQTTKRPSTRHRPQPTVGRPLADDDIRYDLLVRN